MRTLRIWLGIVSLLGIAASVYALYLHYAPTSSSFCNVSATLNCDLVNRSTYAVIAGIPVAFIGALGYLGLFVGSLLLGKVRQMPLLLLCASIGGLVFSLYLTGIEAFVLKTYCIVCIVSQLCIITALVLSIRIFSKSRSAQGEGTL